MITPDNIDEYLAEPCPADGCARPRGEHSVREFFEHAPPLAALDLPYERVGGDPIMAEIGDVPLADHVNARAGFLEGEGGNVPIVVLDFAVGVRGQAPVPRAAVGFIGTPEGMRFAGTLIRAACFDAAAHLEGGNRAQRRQRRRHG